MIECPMCKKQVGDEWDLCIICGKCRPCCRAILQGNVNYFSDGTPVSIYEKFEEEYLNGKT
jgi:NAD-dependent SIR2 family protein deacetylase